MSAVAEAAQHPEPRARPRILLVGEAVTLAHAVRPFTLAGCLDPARYEVAFACDPRFDALLQDPGIKRFAIRSIPGKRFLDAAVRARLAHDVRDLRGYIEEELALLRDFRPELVVGDFRHSLAVSAPASGVVYANLCNAYWSPYARPRFELAAHPLAPVLGMGVVQKGFELVRPIAFAYYARPLNRLRRTYGLPPIPHDLRGTFTFGDFSLYADVPELVPTSGLPENHSYLGPVGWSPTCPLPDWWSEARRSAPLAFVNLGSSGPIAILETVLDAVRDAGLSAVVATAGRIPAGSVRGTKWAADLLPGDEVAPRCAVVVCNGGSPGANQALAHGVPVLGIASNTDQMLNMHYVREAGAGVLLREREASRERVRAAVHALATDPAYRTAATGLAKAFAAYDARARFRAFVDRVVGPQPPRG